MRQPYSELPNSAVSAAHGIDYAYRDTGGHDEAVPLVLLQHFRGNLDSWDPALIDALASNRQVVAFDNAGVGGSGGTAPRTVAEMARDAIAFLDAMNIDGADILGFSLGSFVAQEIALIRPDVVRRLVLASSAPQGAAGMHGWAPDVIDAVGARQSIPDRVLDVFYAPSSSSRQAGQQAFARMSARTTDRDKATIRESRLAQYDAVCAWGVPNHLAAESERYRRADLHRQRRQRSDGPAALLLSARRPHPAGARQDLSRLGTRLPVPAPRRIRRRRRIVSRRMSSGPAREEKHIAATRIGVTRPQRPCPAGHRAAPCAW